MEACFETHLGVTYASVIETVGFPAVNTSATFRYPISVGEQLTVVVSIASLGRSSVLWNFHIYNEQERLCAVGEVKTVCIPVSTGVFAFESVEIPEDLRPKLLTLENH